jgi:hypothetical protein
MEAWGGNFILETGYEGAVWIHFAQDIVLWHEDPLLGNDHEISKCRTAVAK